MRFPVAQELSFRVLDRKEGSRTGRGKTVDLSSQAVRFTSDQPPALDSLVELSIDWPVLLEGRCLLKLVVLGTVTRLEYQTAVVSVRATQFRTRGRMAELQVAAQAG